MSNILRKKSVAAKLPILIRDSSGVPITGLTDTDVTVNYQKQDQTGLTLKSLSPSNWIEIGQGLYNISFTATELNTEGDFIYPVTGSGFEQKTGLVRIETYTNTDLKDAIDQIINIAQTIDSGIIIEENIIATQERLDTVIIKKTDKIYSVTAIDKNTGNIIDLTGVTDIQYAIKKSTNDPDYINHKDLGPETNATKSILSGNAQLDYEAKNDIKVEGNDTSIEYVDPGTNNSPLTVEVIENVIERNFAIVTNRNIKVSLATDGGGTIISTANDIKAAIEGDGNADELVNITVPGTGASVVTAISQTYLEGGLSGGIEITDAEAGQFKITIPQDETFEIDEGTYVYDIISTITGTRVQLICGEVEFKTGVTE
jgi:hypothetical protein